MRDECVMCRGRGMIVDTGAPEGQADYLRPPQPPAPPPRILSRLPYTLAMASETLAVACNDGSLWLGALDSSGAWKWKRLPDVPQGDVAAEV